MTSKIKHIYVRYDGWENGEFTFPGNPTQQQGVPMNPAIRQRIKVLRNPVYGPSLVTIALRSNAAKHGRLYTVHLLPMVQP